MDKYYYDTGDMPFVLPMDLLDAVVLDLDGVITDTASLHEAAWKKLFDHELSLRGIERRFTREDYLRYVDGKPRRDGVKSFLAVVGIDLPEGSPEDADTVDSVWGIARRKDEYFLEELSTTGPRPYPGTIDMLKRLHMVGMPLAVVSASRNCKRVLDAAGLTNLFQAIVDGEEALRMGLPGKPDPATFLEASRRLGRLPKRTMIVEDAIAGVHAGMLGGFGLVVGVDRVGQRDALREGGADIVVSDLGLLDLPNDYKNIIKRLIRERYSVKLTEDQPLLCSQDGGAQDSIAQDSIAQDSIAQDSIADNSLNSLAILGRIIQEYEDTDSKIIRAPLAQRLNLFGLDETVRSAWVFTTPGTTGESTCLKELLKKHPASITQDTPRAIASWLSLADGIVGTRGAPEEDMYRSNANVFISGLYRRGENGIDQLMELPSWLDAHVPNILTTGNQDVEDIRFLDMRNGILSRLILSEDAMPVFTIRFASLAIPGIEVFISWNPGDPTFGYFASAEDAIDTGQPQTPELFMDTPAVLSGAVTHLQQQDQNNDQSWIDTSVTISNLGSSVARAIGDFIVPIKVPQMKPTTTPSRTALVRIASYKYSHSGTPPHREAIKALVQARNRGITSLLEEQRNVWQDRWGHADIEISGDPDMTRSIRFAMFHLASTVVSSGEAAVGARGLSGPAYSGHVFWDSDVFVLPMLAATNPRSARAMLEYRLRRLDAAREAASKSGRSGLRFPWESAHEGIDVTPQSGMDEHGNVVPILTGKMEEHISADVAWAAWQLASWTGRWQFLKGAGMPLIVETARYWASRVERDGDGNYHISHIIGPDEYHENVDDNAYTNIMAAWNLRRGAELLARLHQFDLADFARQPTHLQLSIRKSPGKQGGNYSNSRLLEDAQDSALQEAGSWIEIANSLVDGYDPLTGIYEQFAGYGKLEPLTIADIGEPPLAADLILGRERLQESQIIKQADVMMAYLLVPEELHSESLSDNLDFYLNRTAHGSSLSPGVHAALLAQVGRVDEAVDMLRLACAIDIDDLTGTVGGGLHIANFGAIWQAIVKGFAGIKVIRPDDGILRLDPHIPDNWGTLTINILWHGKPIRLLCHIDGVEIFCSSPLRIQLSDNAPVSLEPPGGRLK